MYRDIVTKFKVIVPSRVKNFKAELKTCLIWLQSLSLSVTTSANVAASSVSSSFISLFYEISLKANTLFLSLEKTQK